MRRGPGHPPKITDAELIALAVAQMFLAVPSDRKFLAFARRRLGHLFPYLPKQLGYNKRMRALADALRVAPLRSSSLQDRISRCQRP